MIQVNNETGAIWNFSRKTVGEPTGPHDLLGIHTISNRIAGIVRH
jgi:hypothetical protein